MSSKRANLGRNTLSVEEDRDGEGLRGRTPVSTPSSGEYRQMRMTRRSSPFSKSSRDGLSQQGSAVYFGLKGRVMAKSKLSDPETRAKLISTIRQVRSERAPAYHVISSRGDWVVIGEGIPKARKRFEDQGRAIEHAKELARKSQTDLFVHSRDGRVLEQVSFRDSGTPAKQRAAK